MRIVSWRRESERERGTERDDRNGGVEEEEKETEEEDWKKSGAGVKYSKVGTGAIDRSPSRDPTLSCGAHVRPLFLFLFSRGIDWNDH